MDTYRCEQCGLAYQTLAPVCERCSYSDANSNSQQVADELRRIARVGAVKHPRLLAAIWFACAACIPGLIILWFIRDGGDPAYKWALILITSPAAIASLYGACIGAGILDSYDVNTGLRAFRRGAFIALMTYLTIIPLGFLVVMILDPSVSYDVMAVIGTFFLVLFYGFILVGWWGVLIGGLAGWLLYRLHR